VAGVVGGRNAGGHEVLPYNNVFACYFFGWWTCYLFGEC